MALRGHYCCHSFDFNILFYLVTISGPAFLASNAATVFRTRNQLIDIQVYLYIDTGIDTFLISTKTRECEHISTISFYSIQLILTGISAPIMMDARGIGQVDCTPSDNTNCNTFTVYMHIFFIDIISTYIDVFQAFSFGYQRDIRLVGGPFVVVVSEIQVVRATDSSLSIFENKSAAY